MNAEAASVAEPMVNRVTCRLWARRLLVGNPFYLVSAAFLLYGIYQISLDTNFAGKESSQLLFNFTALQVYEGLLIITSLFLARRRIWYDATLLIIIEVSFVLIPFILVSQAIFLGKGLAYVMCGVTLLLAAVKFSALRRFYPGLNFPPTLLGMGAAIAAANAMLPLMFKSILETDQALLIARLQEAEIRLILMGILPLLAASANLLPRHAGPGELPSQKRWLPFFVMFLWTAATAVHIYSVRYVYRLEVEFSYFTPTVWILAWTMVNRSSDFGIKSRSVRESVLMIFPILIAMPAFQPAVAHVKELLLVCNLAACLMMYLRERRDAFTLQLVLVSATCAVIEIARGLLPAGADFRNAPWLMLFCMIYPILAALTSRSPKIGLAGAICAGCAAGVAFNRYEGAAHIGIQTCLGLLMLHSLGWQDRRGSGATVLRGCAAAAWVADSFAWAGSHTLVSMMLPAGLALSVIGGYLLVDWLYHHPALRIIKLTSFAVLGASPAQSLTERLKAPSFGVTLVIISFLLFALGTWFALRRNKWLSLVHSDGERGSTDVPADGQP